MLNVDDVKTVHIELTDKCQAQCPMCARNYHGGATRPFIRNGDISIEQFKEWFPRKFLAHVNNFYSCGNYGDPAFAQDCLEIFAYVRECNPHARLAIHTNGGMRTPQWWGQFAQAIAGPGDSEVVFAVDGFKGQHELYRRNTKFDKVIENMTAFIAAGGTARVDSLVFAHNEHNTRELEGYLLDLGVTSVNFVSTKRFYEMTKFEVQNIDGSTAYYLEPAQLPEYKQYPNKSLENLLDPEYLKHVVSQSIVDPMCISEQGIYVDPYGSVFPCCWIGGDYLEQHVKETLPIHKLRNLAVQRSKKMLEDIGVPKCNNGALALNVNLWPRLAEHWKGTDKCLTCVRQCSKTIYGNPRKYE